MGDDDSPSGGFVERMGDLEWREAEPDISTSPEALDILRRKGVAAWREWVASKRAGGES